MTAPVLDPRQSALLLVDAMAGLDEPAHRFAVEYVFPRVGWVSRSEQVLADLQADR